jgi:hypothetical protein
MNKLKNIILIGIVALFSTSCEDFLEVQSKNQLTLDNYYTTYEECVPQPHHYTTRFGLHLPAHFTGILAMDGETIHLPLMEQAFRLSTYQNIRNPNVENGWASLYLVVTQSDYVINNKTKPLNME